MQITSETISVGLESIDRFMDRCGLSCINNLVNCVTKVCMGIYRFFYGDVIHKKSEKGEKVFLEGYWSYIDSKDALTCGLGLVPVLGSILIWAKGKFKNEKPLPTVNQPAENIKSASFEKILPQEDEKPLDPENHETQEGGEIITRS